MEQKFIINLGRELGSGGSVIGKAVAQRLGVEFYDKSLIKLAAKESGISADIFEEADEHSRKSWMTTLVGYLKNPFSGGELPSSSVLSGEALFKIQSDVIRDIASRDSALFVGRCADYILRDYPLSINIFISADMCDRVERLMQLHSLTKIEAEQMISTCDESRAAYYSYYGNGRWGHSSSYDLCINSSCLGLEKSVDYIIEFIKLRLELK